MKSRTVLPMFVVFAVVISSLGILSHTRVEAAESMSPVSLSIDAANVLHTGVGGGTRLGVNMDYWWDDQANRTSGAVPLATAAGSMGKFWRYPGGEKADGYLWSLPPFTAPNPKLARTGNRDWPAMDSAYWSGGNSNTGYFTHPIQDFDEFMAGCQAAGCIPIIVVAYDGVYKNAQGNGDSLTWQEALDTSAGWVHYANNVKGYNIKYWEIGNETYNPGYMGGDPGRAQQAQDFITFCNNMKAQDPTIWCGINTETQADWGTLFSIAHEHIDFIDVHAYEGWTYANYGDYAANGINPNVKVDWAWTPLQNYPISKDRIKIVVGETGGITFGINGTWTAADLGHALMTFENMAKLQQDSRIEHSAFWNTRWIEQNKAGNVWPNYPASEYDSLKPDNTLSPQGWALKLLKDYSLDRMVGTTSPHPLAVFASTNSANNQMNIWLVNRSTASTTTTINLQNYSSPSNGAVSVYKGTGSSDMYPTFTQAYGSVSVSSNTINITLDPVSITIIQLGSGSSGPTATPTTGPSPTPTSTPAPTNTPGSCSGTTNIALNKTVTASSVQHSNYQGAKAVDGNTSTFWWAKKKSNLSQEWITVDLGSNQTVCKVTLNQGDRYAKTFSIQVSTDNTNWTTVASTTTGTSGITMHTFSAVSARYVRMISSQWHDSGDRVKLIEFEIYQ